jgi:hypothetical protein
MAISTDRATIEERAAAWDYLMNSTETGSAAITKAWCWLRDQVEAREAATAVQLRSSRLTTASSAMRRKTTRGYEQADCRSGASADWAEQLLGARVLCVASHEVGVSGLG